MPKQWTADDILELAGGYQRACVLTAAADLDIFNVLSAAELTAPDLATQLGADPRAITILLDALVALELLVKHQAKYSAPAAITDLLTDTGSSSVLPMVRHQATCLRRWVQLPQVTRSGNPAESAPSIRGPESDYQAFIGAMHNVSSPMAEALVAELQPLRFNHLLDIGGASGTWTIALLHAVPEARATLFDLPEVIPLAQNRISDAGFADRVTFAPGNFYDEELPPDIDFAWLGAIAHQNSRPQNRDLFTKIHQALNPDGIVMIRDVVMDESRTSPPGGAMFAVNMLVATPAGGTYTFKEYHDDLAATGFTEVTLIRQDQFMNSLIRAKKP